MAPYDSLRPPPPESPGKPKSQGKAFVYNLLIPGTGHLYAGYKSGWVNIGIEGLTWLTYFYYQDLGHQKENQYEAYADGHWDYDKWISECGCQGRRGQHHPGVLRQQAAVLRGHREDFDVLGRVGRLQCHR
jgi:hypothetical protein